MSTKLHWKTSLFLLSALAFCCVSALPTQAQIRPSTSANAYDPSDLYLQAWYLMKDSDVLAKKQNYLGALNKGKQAERALAKIASDHPSWKINMVRDCRDRLSISLQNYTLQAKNAPITPNKAPGIITENESKTPPRTTQDSPKLPSFDDLEAERRVRAAQIAKTQNVPSFTPPPTVIPSVSSSDGTSSYEQLEQEHQRTLIELRTVVNALRQTRQQLNQVMTQSVKSAAGEEVYKKELDKLRKEIEVERKAGNTVLVTLTDKLKKLEEEQAAAIQQKKMDDALIAQLQAQLADNEAQLHDITEERDALIKERDQLKTLVDLNSPAKTKALLDNNLTLVAKLKEAQDRLTTLEAEKLASADQEGVLTKQLDSARTEIVQIKLSLANIRDENIGYRRRISELNTKLTNTIAELEKTSNKPDTEPIIIEENKLLKEIVTKQIRTLNTLEKARDLLLAAYKRMKAKDPSLSNAFKLLNDKNTVELTPAEKSIADLLGSKIQAQDLDTTNLDTAAISLENENQNKIREELEIEALGHGAANAFAKGRYAGAEQLYKTLLDLRPDHLAALVNMGTIMIQRGLSNEAIPRLQRATELAPDMAAPFFLLAVAQYNVGMDKPAIASFSQTVKLDPANAEAYLYLGNIESTAGNFNRAIAHYRSALKINDRLSDAFYNISQLYYRQNKLNEARTAYDQAILAGANPNPSFERQLRTPAPKTEEETQTKSGNKPEQISKETPKAPAKNEIPTPTATTPTTPEPTTQTPSTPQTAPAPQKIEVKPPTPPNTPEKKKPNPRSRFG